jgi:hypothetical protein
MPRPKPNKASPHFISHGQPLSDTAKAKLIDLLGYGKVNLLEESIHHQMPGMKILRREHGAPLQLVRDADTMRAAEKTNVGNIILDVEQALGIYIDGAEHLDHVPRPTHYVNAFTPIERQARKLSELLFEMGYYFSDELYKRNLDPNNIAADLLKLAEVSKTAIGDFNGKPSRGAPRNTALCEVIRHLRRIFRNNYKGPLTGRKKKNNIQYRAEEERRELSFVEEALHDARIIKVRGSTNAVARLFLDPRCALIHERPATMERLANRMHRRYRQQKGNK